MTEPNQHSHLLRLWRDHAGAPWRATLIDTMQPEARRYFATPEACLVFLHGQICTVEASESDMGLELRSSIVSQTKLHEK